MPTKHGAPVSPIKHVHNVPRQKRPSILWQTVRKRVPTLVAWRRHFRMHRVPLHMFNPETSGKRSWDIMLVFCVLYTTCVVPYRLCFHRDATGGFATFESVIDMGFFIDIVLNFFTGIYLPNGDISYDIRVVAWAYLRGWFVVDFFSTIPLDQVARFFGFAATSTKALTSAKLLRGLKVLRLFKLARLRRLSKMFSSLENAVNTNQSMLSLLKLVLLMLIVAHFVACIWFAIGSQGGDDSWIHTFGFDDSERQDYVLLQYVASVYWAIVTMTTIGYGDIVARTNSERLVNIAVMAVCVSFFGYVIGTISSLVTNLNVSAALYEERMMIIKEYIISRQLPKHIGKRVRAHFEYYYQNRSVFKERCILTRLPLALRNEMIHQVYEKWVSTVIYFTDCHESLVSDIVMGMQPFSAMKDDFIYCQHEIAAHVYFLMKGKVQLTRTSPLTKKEMRLTSHDVGEHFGELEVYDQDHGNGVRICSAVAKSFCELTFLSREAILEISNRWPAILIHFKHTAYVISKGMRRRAGDTNSDTSEHEYLFKDEAQEQAMITSSQLVKKSMRAHVQPKISNRIVPFSEMPHESVVAFTDMQQESRALDKSKLAPASKYTAISFDVETKGHGIHSNSNGEPQEQIAHSDSDIDASTRTSDPESPSQRKKIILASLPEHLRRKHTLILNEPEIDEPIPREVPAQIAVHKEDPSNASYVHTERMAISTSNEPDCGQELTVAHHANMQSEQTDHDDEVNLLSMVAKIRDRNVPTSSQTHVDHIIMKGTYLLHPQEPFMITWQLVVGLGIMYSIVVVPFRLGFSYDAVGAWYTFELIIDGFFLMDILINFRTAYFNDDRVLIINRRKIFWRYAKGWFIFDLTSSIPIDEVVSFIVGSSTSVNFFPTKLLRLARIARLLKLARLMKLSRISGRLREIMEVSPSLERLFRLLLLMVLVCHWDACIFHVAMLESESQNLQNWCSDLFFPDVKNFIRCSDEIGLRDRYIAALYWAFTTLTTVGYGDVKPNLYSVYELSVVIFLVVVNSTVFGYIVSSVMTLIQNIDPSDREYKLLMNEMKDYLSDCGINTRLRKHVKTVLFFVSMLLQSILLVLINLRLFWLVKHYAHYISCTSLFPEKKIFEKMCPSLRFDIARLVAGETLFAIPLITVMEDSFKGFVSYALFLLTPVCIIRGDKVCRSGAPGIEMYFLVEGECDLLNSVTRQGRIIGVNAVFEQYALMAKPDELYRSVSTVTALSPKVILYSLSTEGFKKLEDASPAVSTYFLSQLAAVLLEDDLFRLSPEQTMNVEAALRSSQPFRAVADTFVKPKKPPSVMTIALAALLPRRSSEWAPDLLAKRLRLIAEQDMAKHKSMEMQEHVLAAPIEEATEQEEQGEQDSESTQEP